METYIQMLFGQGGGIFGDNGLGVKVESERDRRHRERRDDQLRARGHVAGTHTRVCMYVCMYVCICIFLMVKGIGGTEKGETRRSELVHMLQVYTRMYVCMHNFETERGRQPCAAYA
jgi:hypothetical protein